MSFQIAVTKLRAPVKELVLAVTNNGTRLVGRSERDQKDVVDWIEKASESSLVEEANFKDLASQIVPRTYIVSTELTAADVALYGALHPIISKLQPTQAFAYPSLMRYFDHIQSCPPVRDSADALPKPFDVVKFNLEEAPKLERNTEAPKKKEKAPKVEKDATTSAPAAPPVEKKKDKQVSKDPGEEKKKSAANNKAAAEDKDPIPSMIDLRVGHIIDIKKHPDADGLYVEQIDLGEDTGPRTVVSGLVNYIPIEEMRDKYLVAVCNLKPANMRGVKSFAMVLCATSKDGKDSGIELIQPPANSKPGDRVYFEGPDFEEGIPLPQLNPKKKIFEAIQPGFITLDSKEAAWVNPISKSVHRIRTKDGICVAPTFVGASLS